MKKIIKETEGQMERSKRRKDSLTKIERNKCKIFKALTNRLATRTKEELAKKEVYLCR